MSNEALGLIEVRGFLGAVVAADAALKAANVSLLSVERVKAGLNTVQLRGDISAVQSAVDAGVVAIESLNCYLASHVIARMDQQTKKLLITKKDQRGESEVENMPVTIEEIDVTNDAIVEEYAQTLNTTAEVEEQPSIETASEVIEVTVTDKLVNNESDDSLLIKKAAEQSKKHQLVDLEKLKVVQLRAIAYREPTIKLTKKQIKFANRKTLLDALLNL